MLDSYEKLHVMEENTDWVGSASWVEDNTDYVGAAVEVGANSETPALVFHDFCSKLTSTFHSSMHIILVMGTAAQQGTVTGLRGPSPLYVITTVALLLF